MLDFQLVNVSWVSPLIDFVYTAGGTNLETVSVRATSTAPFAAAIMLTPISGACEVPDSFVLATGKADTTIVFQVHVLLPDSGGAPARSSQVRTRPRSPRPAGGRHLHHRASGDGHLTRGDARINGPCLRLRVRRRRRRP